MHRYLVVANQTLGGPKLLDAIRDRMARGPAEFWVLAPATPITPLATDFGALSGAFPVDPTVFPSAADVRDEGVAVARANLDTELSRLREIGATADGAVGDPNPMVAIERAVAKQQFDEIILSTLPPGISRWLAMDLPHRVRRKINVPLTVIAASKIGAYGGGWLVPKPVKDAIVRRLLVCIACSRQPCCGQLSGVAQSELWR